MDTIIVFDPAPGPDLAAPTLSSTSPADNATDIAIDATIDLVFSETVTLETGNIVLRDNDGGFADLETFNVATGTGSGGGTVALATTSVTNDTVRITPGTNMVNNIEHAVRVAATCIDDLAGNSYAGITDDTTVSFTTVSSASFSPADLFAGSEDGFILAPGDTALNELWQENDGSQSTASANGDLVGEVVCLTTSRAARAGITGNRPTRLSSGGVEAITFGPAETGFNVFSPSLPVDDFAVYIAFRILGFNSGSNGEMTPVTTASGGTGNGLQMLMHSRTAGTPNTWEMGLFNVSTFNIDSPTAAFDENTFYRVCSQTPDTGNFYVNGSTDGSYADSEGGTDPSIGFDTNNSGREVYGDIALMVIIDRALTAGEIAQLDTYAATRIP